MRDLQGLQLAVAAVLKLPHLPLVRLGGLAGLALTSQFARLSNPRLLLIPFSGTTGSEFPASFSHHLA